MLAGAAEAAGAAGDAGRFLKFCAIAVPYPVYWTTARLLNSNKLLYRQQRPLSII